MIQIGKTNTLTILRQTPPGMFLGNDENEVGTVISNSGVFNIEKGTIVVRVDPKYYRPTEVDLLIGDPTKAKEQLGWKLQYDLPALVKDMME